MRRRPALGSPAALLGALSFAAASLPAAATAQTFRYVQVDVGQGDAALVVAPGGCAALLDGGPTGSGARIKAAAHALGVTHLELAVASHLHADHIGGLDEVEQGSNGIPIGQVYDHGGSFSTLAFSQYASQFAGRRITPVAGDERWLCGQVRLRFVASGANGLPVGDENARSVVVKVSYGSFDALVGGDLTGFTPDVETGLAQVVGEVELYKVHHHGSRTSSNEPLLGALLPTVSFISLGARNTYGHPHPEVIARLDAVGSEIWMTQTPGVGARGDIVLESLDGLSYTVTQGARIASFGTKGPSAPAPEDTTPPSIPADLVAVARSGAVELAWSPASDDRGVSGYVIWRDGEAIATSPATSFRDSGARPETTHRYAVSAYDEAANESAPSAEVLVTTPCELAITDLVWRPRQRELSLRGHTSNPAAKATVRAGKLELGVLTPGPGGALKWRRPMRVRPACLWVQSSCGGAAQACF